MKNISIEDYFTYHPPTTEERKVRHENVNNAALTFALVIDKCCLDESLKQMAIAAIQNARMLANQAITIDELRGKSDD